MRFRSPSPALVVATVALVVAVGGTGYAVTKLPRNSVGSAQVKKSAITSNHVLDGSLRGIDFATGQLPAGPQGAQGPAGPAGRDGIGDIVIVGSGDRYVTSGSYASGTLYCPTGYYAVGTGMSWKGYISYVKSYGYFVGYFLDNALGFGASVSAQAICASGTYSGSLSVTSSARSAGGTPAMPTEADATRQWQKDLQRLRDAAEATR
jgi:hypothetical protein